MIKLEKNKNKKIKRKSLPRNNNTRKNTTDYSDEKDNVSSSMQNDHLIETAEIIPVVEEDFNLSKKTTIQQVRIVKRLATRTEKIEVPISYEELYVNNKKLKIYEKEEEGIFSKLKGTIAHGITTEDNSIEYRHADSSRNVVGSSSSSQTHDENLRRDDQGVHNHDDDTDDQAIPLMEGQEKNETEKTVPIWGEEILVTKRKVKLGEIVIKKRVIRENKQVDIDIRKEKITIEYPNGVKDELTGSGPR
jgi:stress response protein YsnF